MIDAIFGLAVIVLVLILFPVRQVTILEYERGLMYVNGRFRRILSPGRHWIWRFSTGVTRLDVRPRAISIPGQEVLSSDGITIKVSLATEYEIVDPETAINKVQNYMESFYLAMQVTLREVVGSAGIEELLEKRAEYGAKLQELAAANVEQYGLRLISASIKDIMLPGDLKRIFAQIVKARKEGLASLEKARGETASLRNLANAAKMVESNPALMQLRMLHSISDSNGNTFVVGLPHMTPVPVKSEKSAGAHEPEELTE